MSAIGNAAPFGTGLTTESVMSKSCESHLSASLSSNMDTSNNNNNNNSISSSQMSNVDAEPDINLNTRLDEQRNAIQNLSRNQTASMAEELERLAQLLASKTGHSNGLFIRQEKLVFEGSVKRGAEVHEESTLQECGPTKKLKIRQFNSNEITHPM
jgi:hypothetical protein